MKFPTNFLGLRSTVIQKTFSPERGIHLSKHASPGTMQHVFFFFLFSYFVCTARGSSITMRGLGLNDKKKAFLNPKALVTSPGRPVCGKVFR